MAKTKSAQSKESRSVCMRCLVWFKSAESLSGESQGATKTNGPREAATKDSEESLEGDAFLYETFGEKEPTGC